MTSPTLARQPPVPFPEPAETRAFAKTHAAPGVRRFARELGVDLGNVVGSGRKGRVLESDVKAYVRQVMRGETSAAGVGVSGVRAMPAPAETDFQRFGEVEVQPLDPLQSRSGAALLQTWLNVPRVTHHQEADVTELEALRRTLADEADRRGLHLSMPTFLMKALAATLKAFPAFNASLAAGGESRVLKKYVHIGITVESPGGLVIPVIRDVDRKSVFTLAGELAGVSARARDGTLEPAEMQGGCMSIFNLGGIGGSASSPMVKAPEVAMLGVTRARMRPLWSGSEFVPRLMLPLDLSYDHRLIDGAEAARFLRHFCAHLEDLYRLVL